MPSLRTSRVELSPDRYRLRSDPQSMRVPASANVPAPEMPVVIRRSPIMISSLPSISTDVDGVARQFYGGQRVPTRRLILP